MLIVGIDEAGRGAMIGPMVIAGVVIDKKDEKKLMRLGVRDSKQLTPQRRAELAPKIEHLAKSTITIPVQPCMIDNYRAKKVNLDRIEAMKMAEIINILGCEKIYIDALTANPQRYGVLVRSYLRDKEINKKIKIVAENFADVNYPVVAAASILAKVERDRIIDDIKQKVKIDFGNGYPHDEQTVEFVEQLIKQRKRLPAYVRKSWITTQLLQEKNWQRKLKDFIFGKKKNIRRKTDG